MKVCKGCGKNKPETTEYFNKLPSGSFRGKCKKCMAENTKKHYYKNPQAVKGRAAKYLQQKNKAEGECTYSQALEIRRSQKDLCKYCGVELNGGGELDHKIPISRGGSNWPNNMAWACLTCNRDKHSKTVEEFMKWRRVRGL